MSAPSDAAGDLRFDWERGERTGVPEAVLCTGKRIEHLTEVARGALERRAPLLFTRREPPQATALLEALGEVRDGPLRPDYDPVSRTLQLGMLPVRASLTGSVAVVAAGSSDTAVAREALRTLEFQGLREVPFIVDVGVAGLWRLLSQVDNLAERRVVVAAAGMEGALFSVLSGLVRGLVIAVPTSVGYGVSADGRAALSSALASCAPGVVVVNVDNGFGAACAALKALGPDPAGGR